MSSIENYKMDIVERTSEILTTYYHKFEKEDREATFLLNCLLGLIVSISENEKNKNIVFGGKIDDEFLALIPNKIGFIKKDTQDIDLIDENTSARSINICRKDNLKEQTKLWFINQIRNGIAHQNIEGVNEDNKWFGIRLWNIDKASIKNFEIVFSIEELKTFAIKLSNNYIMGITSSTKNNTK